MKKFLILLSLLVFFSFGSNAQTQGKFSFKIAKLKYQGGGDWYANPSSLPNLLEFIRQNSTIPVAPSEDIVEPGSSQIFQYPYVYMTGHGNVVFSEPEAKNLRNYLVSGGFLHIDDNYGMDKFVRREIKKIFPETELVDLPYSHPIYHQQFVFEKGLPKVHEHDGKPPEGLGIIYQGRLVLYYSFECDLGDGWEDPDVHHDPEMVRQSALKMGLNLVMYAINN